MKGAEAGLVAGVIAGGWAVEEAAVVGAELRAGDEVDAAGAGLGLKGDPIGRVGGEGGGAEGARVADGGGGAAVEAHHEGAEVPLSRGVV